MNEMSNQAQRHDLAPRIFIYEALPHSLRTVTTLLVYGLLATLTRLHY